MSNTYRHKMAAKIRQTDNRLRIDNKMTTIESIRHTQDKQQALDEIARDLTGFAETGSVTAFGKRDSGVARSEIKRINHRHRREATATQHDPASSDNMATRIVAHERGAGMAFD